MARSAVGGSSAANELSTDAKSLLPIGLDEIPEVNKDPVAGIPEYSTNNAR